MIVAVAAVFVVDVPVIVIDDVSVPNPPPPLGTCPVQVAPVAQQAIAF